MEHEGMGRDKGGSGSDFSHHFRDMKFPARKHDLMNHAKQQGVDKEKDVMDWLQRLDDKKEYKSIDDLKREFGKAA
ncbi:MAG: DUF2795 domain-containing protein [Deltaproteobacteria bacterium]|nr:DUF2795 domain-containing protein [Deltaproteobacteria bacterium]